MHSKPTFLLCGLLLCALPVSAQYFTRTEQFGFYNQIDAMRPEGDSILWLCTFSDEDYTQRLHRVRVDGQTSTTTVQVAGKVLDYDFLPFGTGILTTHHYFPCDLLVARQLAFYNQDGLLTWTRDIGIPDPKVVPTKLLPGPGQTFWLFQQDSIPLHCNADGDVIEAGPFALPVFSGYHPTPEGKFLSYGPAGLALYSPQLNFVQFGLQHQYLIQAIPLPDGRVCAISKDSLFLLAADFTVLIQKQGLAQVDSMVDLSVYGNEVRVLARKGASVQLGLYDLNLAFVELLSQGPGAPFRPHLIHQDAKRLVLAGEEWAMPANAPQVICLKSSPAMAVSFDVGVTDAALTDLVLPQKPVVQHLNPWGGFTVTLDSASVVVENKGSTVLHSVNVNAVLDSYSFWCDVVEPRYFHRFDNLNLAPGESRTLFLGRVQWSNVDNFFPLELNFCFWTSLPNDSLDPEHSNNQNCRTIGVILSAPTPGEAVLPLSIAPNPVSSGTALVQWPGEAFTAAHIRVYDTTGRLLLHETTASTSWMFHWSEWPAGLYPVQVQTEDGRLFAGKIVVE